MNDFLPALAATLIANMATVVFVIGVMKLWRVKDNRDATLPALACVVVPLIAAFLGMVYVSGH